LKSIGNLALVARLSHVYGLNVPVALNSLVSIVKIYQ